MEFKDVVFRMVGIADTRQPMVVNHFAFLRNVRRLLGKHVTEWVVDERCLSVRWVVDFRAAVAHVVNGWHHVALDIFYIVLISLFSSFLHIRAPIIGKIIVNNKAAFA